MNQTMVELKDFQLVDNTPQVMTSIVEVETVGKHPCKWMYEKECK